MTIIDSQAHAYEANTAKRPWYNVPNRPDPGTGACKVVGFVVGSEQMRWNRATVAQQPFLDMRTAVLDDTPDAASRHRYQGFRPANDDVVVALAA